MSQKVLLNQLQLGYSPLTAYEFASMKNNEWVDKALQNASLYIIAQRPVTTFENAIPDMDKFQMNFEIHQKGNPNILNCKLPIDQEEFGTTEEDVLAIGFNKLDKSIRQELPPFNNVHGFSLSRPEESGNQFIVWFSPEKLLQNWWKGQIDCEVIGDYRSFLQYKVHYVGKATKQSILKRLTGHSTFQDILSLEAPVTEKQLPANEIIVLCFEFRENLQLQTFGINSNIASMTAAVKGEDYPDQQKIFLDAEKALIKAIKPNYNKELFEKYPTSKDGLYGDNYTGISYTFIDPITLVYQNGEIQGGLSFIGGDSILVINNKEFKVVKHKLSS